MYDGYSGERSKQIFQVGLMFSGMLPSLNRGWQKSSRRCSERGAVTHRPAVGYNNSISSNGNNELLSRDRRKQLLQKVKAGELTLAGDPRSYCYSKQNPLGSGFSSTVYRGYDLTRGDDVAVKVVSKDSQRLLAADDYYRRLYSVLKTVRHENLLPLRGFLEDNNSYYIISPICDGGTLVEYVSAPSFKSVSTSVMRSLISQILAGLHELHSHGIVHRDIKLDNILFTRNEHDKLQIIDFDMGWSKHAPNVKTSIVGTKDYMAPESFLGQYSPQSDLWSVGVILFIFLEGHFPFTFQSHSLEDRTARDVIRRGFKVRSTTRQKHPYAVSLCERLLDFDPKRRPSSAIEAASHPWFFIGSLPPTPSYYYHRRHYEDSIASPTAGRCYDTTTNTSTTPSSSATPCNATPCSNNSHQLCCSSTSTRPATGETTRPCSNDSRNNNNPPSTPNNNRCTPTENITRRPPTLGFPNTHEFTNRTYYAWPHPGGGTVAPLQSARYRDENIRRWCLLDQLPPPPAMTKSPKSSSRYTPPYNNNNWGSINTPVIAKQPVSKRKEAIMLSAFPKPEKTSVLARKLGRLF